MSRAIPTLTPKNIRNFWRKITRGDDDCWNWGGATMGHGYGAIRIAKQNFPAHRIAYVIGTGTDPAEQCVCHKCDNTKCCNPAHLFLGSHQDNMRDRGAKGRNGCAIGESNGSAKLTPELVTQIRAAVNERGMKYRDAAKEFGVYFSTIGKICTRKIWRHVA